MYRFLAVWMFLAGLMIGCAPAVKTEKVDLPKARKRGALTLVIKKSEDVTAAEASRIKQVLNDKYQLAGFSPVHFSGSLDGAPQSMVLVVTKYEHANSTQTGCAATIAGAIVICPLFAPCALLPGYHEPQFEIIAEVSAYKNGKPAFKKVVSEKSVSNANLVNTGNVQFKDNLEELTIHNFAVKIINEWDRH